MVIREKLASILGTSEQFWGCLKWLGWERDCQEGCYTSYCLSTARMFWQVHIEKRGWLFQVSLRRRLRTHPCWAPGLDVDSHLTYPSRGDTEKVNHLMFVFHLKATSETHSFEFLYFFQTNYACVLFHWAQPLCATTPNVSLIFVGQSSFDFFKQNHSMGSCCTRTIVHVHGAN